MLHNSSWDFHKESNRISLPTSYRKSKLVFLVLLLFFVFFFVNREDKPFFFLFLRKISWQDDQCVGSPAFFPSPSKIFWWSCQDWFWITRNLTQRLKTTWFMQKYKQIFPHKIAWCRGWRHREWVGIYRWNKIGDELKNFEAE